MTDITERLRELADAGFRAFHLRLIPTVPPESVIGVRTPALRALAGELRGTPEAESFLAQLPHRYYDKNNLHCLLLNSVPDFDTAIRQTESFLPYADNWATCDMLRPRAFGRHRRELLPHIRRWLESGREYTVRFGMEMLMCHYLDEAFSPEYPELVAAACDERYYVSMMAAWYFATALGKRWEAALPYLTERRLDDATHNRAIQKAVESFRITDERKGYLRGLRIKRAGGAT